MKHQVKLSGAAVLAAAKGAEDADAAVRRLCLEAIRQAALGMSDRIVIPPPDTLNFPPRDRQTWSEEELQRARLYREEVETELAELRPVVLALAKAGTVFPRALNDQEPAVVRAAAAAVEETAGLRTKLRLKAATVPVTPATKEEEKKDEAKRSDDPLRGTLQAAVLALAEHLAAEEVRVRLACLYALETLGAEAAPAAEALVTALKDDNSYVRWGAARALGRMPPPAVKNAVTELARALADANGDVRVTAAAALERYGPAAKEAVPALGAAAARGADADTQVWAMRALVAVGTDASEAIPDLIAALSGKEPRVRWTAAEALGKLGPGAKPAAKDAAVAALNKAADDGVVAVRLAASRALLDILMPANSR
jgi:HEAT repeat protein